LNYVFEEAARVPYEGTAKLNSRLVLLTLVCLSGGVFDAVKGETSLATQEDAKLESLSVQAQQALAAEDFSAAEKHLKLILELRPDVPEVYSNLGVALFMQRRYPESIAVLKKALQLSPHLNSTKALLGMSYFSLNQFQNSIDVLEELGDSDLLVVQHLAVALLKTKRWERALAMTNRWIELDSDSVDALYYKGQAAILLAVETFEELQEIAPESYRIRQLQGELFRQQGHLEPAIGEYQKAIRENPEVPGLHYSLGEIYRETKRLDQALVEFRAEIALSPWDARTNYMLGNVLLELQNLEESEGYLRQAIEIDPLLAEAYIDLAMLYRTRGQFDQAIDRLQSLIALRPEEETPHYMLHELYRRTENLKKAQEHLQIFLRLKQENERRQAEARGRKSSGMN
jgi:tetratricopeptide (TPR) repeat protein